MAEAKGKPQQNPRNWGKILALAFATINLACVAVGVYLSFLGTLGRHDPVATEDQLQGELAEFRKVIDQGPVLFKMDTFNTNLDGTPRRLISVDVSLEMLDAEGFEEVFELGAGARDAIIRILNRTDFQQVETIQGKLRLKGEIITEINKYLSRGIVKNLYFSNFAVQ